MYQKQTARNKKEIHMNKDRFEQQLDFIIEIDKLKEIVRRSYLFSGNRFENTAEHSWHVAMAALYFSEHFENKIDVNKVVQMLLVHDIVEIDAGDTYIYDSGGYEDKAENERKAANRIFNLLPKDQAKSSLELWNEYESKETPDARFAYCIDRVMPLIHNVRTKGKSWQEHGIIADQVFNLFGPMKDVSQFFYNFAIDLVNEAIEKKYLKTCS